MTTRDAFIAVNRFGLGARRRLPDADVARRVFPGSDAAPRLRDLFRA